MTLPETLQFVSAGCAVIGAVVAVSVSARSQKWRETEEAKMLMDRVDRVESRLDSLEPQIKDLPTKADMATVEGKISRVCEIADRTEKSCNRIEGYFIALGMDRTK